MNARFARADLLARVDLAHERDFRLGRVEIRPSRREIVGEGLREIVEPRVMRVLVALARAKGEILSRDDLTESCWDGVIVGEDAIIRCVGQLRKAGQASGNAFSIETVPRVGYRLQVAESEAAESPRAAATALAPVAMEIAPASPNGPVAAPVFARRNRRSIAAGAAALALVAAGLTLWLPRFVIIVAAFWSAWTSDSVVIHEFEVPAGFAAEGMSGKVVASALLDRLRALQDGTRASQKTRAVEDAWSNPVALSLPEAGLSTTDTQTLLHSWLSHDDHISGSVVEDGTNIVLTVRGDRFEAKSFSGGKNQWHALVASAAEYIYGSCEPYLFAAWLEDQGRNAEAITVARGAFSTASASDKPLLLSVWSNALVELGRYREALEKARQAVALDPDFWLGYNNIMGDEIAAQQEESLVATGREMERRARRGSWFAADVPPGPWENLDYYLSDWSAFLRDLTADIARSGGQGTLVTAVEPLVAEAQARMHDWRAAELTLETSPGVSTDPFNIAQGDFVRALVAIDAGDVARAASLLRAEGAIASKNTAVAANILTVWQCWFALGEALSGDVQKADADIARGGHYVDCYRFKGDIADRSGRWAQARKDYAAAVALAPSLPWSYESWGEALMRHGLRDAAIVKFALAHEKGPHWSDPLEHWGEALAAVGKYDDAIGKYEEAAHYAPNWGHLYLMWGRALDRSGRHTDALNQYRRALALDLSPADRAALARCCG